ncbi:MAG: sensor histidine kinase [Butyrivibrio sp.]
MIESILEILTGVVVDLVTFLWMGKVYEHKYSRKFIYIFAFILKVSTSYLIQQLNIPVLNMAWMVLTTYAVYFLLYKYKTLTACIYNAVFLLFTFFCDIVTVFVLMMINGARLQEMLSNENYMSICYVIYMAEVCLIGRILGVVFTKIHPLAIKFTECIVQLAFCVLAIFVVHNLVLKTENDKDGILIIATILGFFAVDVLLIYVINSVSDIYKSKYELENIKKQNQIQYEHYMELSRQYEESRKVIHDIKKHISVMETVNVQSAEEYGKNITDKMDGIFSYFKCSNPILSAIMSYNIKIAEDSGIKVDTDIQDITFDYMSDIDMTAIFSNLWENAIEANKSVTDNKFINIIIGEVNGFCVICFENNFQADKYKKASANSSKAPHMGLGLSIIRENVMKYNGVFVTDIHDNVFKAEILFPKNNNTGIEKAG